MATTDADQERPTAPERLAEQEPPTGAPPLVQTPSQTVGPFFAFALPFDGGPFLVPPGDPRAIRLHGSVLDGAGAPVPDALLEIWQRDADGHVVAEPGSRRRERGAFTGFGRTATEVDGTYEFRTVLPGPDAGGARWLLLTVFARGLLHHLFTRVYLVGRDEEEPSDALLARLPAERRRTLLARPDDRGDHRFDVRLQGDDETVFLDYPGVR